MKKYYIFSILFYSPYFAFSTCDSTSTFYSELPSNVTILIGDTCLHNNDLEVLDSLISQNNLQYDSSLEIGTQTWFNGRLRFLVAGNYGNSSGVNDTIYTLPDNFGKLTSLASLYLEWNRISFLPESFKELTNLSSVYLNNNILTSLNDSIGNLTNLYFLDLGYNELQTLPPSVCNLENLSYLWLFNNNLDLLPDCFCNLGLDWVDEDNGGYPYFAIGANKLCEGLPECINDTDHLELSLDQFYYSFPVYSPQDCDSATIGTINKSLPYQFRLSSPYPNPFNPSVNINIQVPYDRRIHISVLNLKGHLVEVISDNKTYKQGNSSVKWHSKNHSSGIYFLKFQDNHQTFVTKVILMK